eukprot:6210651-Pleurochrysis_carterae.AAC.1
MPSHLTRFLCTPQAFVARRLLGSGDPPLEVPVTQEEFAAGLTAKIGLDSTDNFTVMIVPNSMTCKFTVPISVAGKVFDFTYGDDPTINVLANYMGNAACVRFTIEENGTKTRTKAGMHRPLWFDLRLRDIACWEYSIATIKSLTASLEQRGICNPKIRQKLGPHSIGTLEFHVSFSGILHDGKATAYGGYPWWGLRHQLDGTNQGIPFTTPCPEYGTATWYATVFHMCPEVLSLANIKRKCFHPNTYQCLCAYTAKQRFQQSSYTPKHKKAKAEDTRAFFQARAAMLKAYKLKMKEANQGASSSTIEEGETPPNFQNA